MLVLVLVLVVCIVRVATRASTDAVRRSELGAAQPQNQIEALALRDGRCSVAMLAEM